jgi:uncharacterized protein (DUF983 family)
MNSISQKSLLASIIQSKCPKCRKGDMFEKGTLLNPRKFSNMNKTCTACSLAFEPEPGYYFGAMFISYAINTGIFIVTWIILSLAYPDYTAFHLVSILILVSVGLLPFIYRISRSMWLSIFVGFEEGN